ncbi:MAG: hypothetical protein IKR86_04090 [Candidatus Methanomethylophilaceae archaeon]|nr:hypothetical protein [Candidatus Methanomethylophilaceae archaeon]
MNEKYDGSPKCVATKAAADILRKAIGDLRRDPPGQVPQEAFSGIRDACGAFLDANPPMFTDTLVRMEKLRDLCRADPELGDEVKAQYVAQEATFVLKELDELMDDYAVRGPVIRFLLRAWRLIRPQVIEIEDGVRYRPRLSTRMAMWEADRLMAKAGKSEAVISKNQRAHRPFHGMMTLDQVSCRDSIYCLKIPIEVRVKYDGKGYAVSNDEVCCRGEGASFEEAMSDFQSEVVGDIYIASKYGRESNEYVDLEMYHVEGRRWPL